MEPELRILIAKALGAWQKDACDFIHPDGPCNGRHYDPAGDDQDFQNLAALIKVRT